ncbi:Flp pilus assembly protein CpaB [Virgibacillus sp. W0430]|uniref:Flp pilus assembly protein CpaB n=1 Tax=Virgibacillus sp. W0430 TaxID=3391580 RepID=UPI003F46BFE0
MNGKKIWIIALLFGVIAAGLMYVVLNEAKMQSTEPVDATVAVAEDDLEDTDVSEDDEALDNDEHEPWKNEIIPAAEGRRAMTIEVTDAQGIAGFITPGAYVDIVTVMVVPEEQKETHHDSATLLVQNVKVLAVGHAADDEETMKRYQMVTIEVTPNQGLMLGFASKYDLYLMLRTEGDKQLEKDRTHVHEDELHEGVFK